MTIRKRAHTPDGRLGVFGILDPLSSSNWMNDN